MEISEINKPLALRESDCEQISGKIQRPLVEKGRVWNTTDFCNRITPFLALLANACNDIPS